MDLFTCVWFSSGNGSWFHPLIPFAQDITCTSYLFKSCDKNLQIKALEMMEYCIPFIRILGLNFKYLECILLRGLLEFYLIQGAG